MAICQREKGSEGMTEGDMIEAMRADAEICNERMRQNLGQRRNDWLNSKPKPTPVPRVIVQGQHVSAKELVAQAADDVPATASQLAVRAQVRDSAARKAVIRLLAQGRIALAGKKTTGPSGTRGRLYIKAKQG